MKRRTKLTVFCMLLSLVLGTSLSACSKKEPEEDKAQKKEVNLFIAASLIDAVGEIVKDFESQNKDIKVVVNPDSSGKLKSQILEGFDCDIFLSASEREMNELKEKDMVVKDSAKDLLKNHLAIIAYKDYDGKVKGLENIKDAKSIALAYGSVPAGFYARKALISEGYLKVKNMDKATIKDVDGKTVSEALGGITVSDKDNVSSVLSAVAEKATEVGFAYSSDVKRNENVKIISEIDTAKTGNIIYPIAKIKPKKESKDQAEITDKLYKALTSESAMKIYEKYGFKVDK